LTPKDEGFFGDCYSKRWDFLRLFSWRFQDSKPAEDGEAMGSSPRHVPERMIKKKTPIQRFFGTYSDMKP
jgi:hypothetical protein